MKPARALWLLAQLLLLPALTQSSSAQEVTLKADTLTLDVPSDSYQARGSVRLVRDGMSLLADSVSYRRLTGDTLAEGNILLEQSGDTLKGSRLSLNLESQQGELLDGEMFVKKTNFRLRGKRVEKTGPEDYRVERGSFTTCDGEQPSWHFEARQLEVTLDEFATGRDAVFYLGSLPVLYTPYILFPVKKERQSGLLLPRLGHSTKKGVYYDQPYYWAATPSQDVTFDLDLESARGAGVGVDYRYLRHGGSEGELQSFGIYDTRAQRFRGELNQKHLELLSPSTTLASDVHLITDRSYFRDYSENSGEYNRQLLSSNISIDHRWERFGLTGELNYLEDLVAANNAATLQRLPALNFIAAGTKAGPLFFSMDAGVVHFQRDSRSGLPITTSQVEGLTGERLNLHPRLSLYQKPLGVLDFSLYGGYQQRFYNAFGAETPGGVRGIGNWDAGSQLSLPLERVYDGRLLHRLTPALEYGYVQAKGDDQIPFFDYDDHVLGQNALKWSLASVLTGKYPQEGGAPEYRDLLYLKLSQGYQFSGERRDLLTLVDPGHRITDLMLESKVTPARGVALLLDGRYDPVGNQVSTANLALELKGEGTRPNLAALGYRYSRGEVNYLEGHFAFPITSQLSASLLGRYSVDKGGLLESRYSLEYQRQCWGIIASYSDRPGNQAFTVNFTLAGIGGLMPVRAF
jgi:LPS-assembly protein